MGEKPKSLRPCPFCGEIYKGGGEFVGVLLMHEKIYKCYWVECETCGAYTPAFKTAEEAVDFWNAWEWVGEKR